jgi:hypothetical protein
MVARLLAIRLAEMTYEEKQRIVDSREEIAAQFPDIQVELSAFIEHLFTVDWIDVLGSAMPDLVVE